MVHTPSRKASAQRARHALRPLAMYFWLRRRNGGIPKPCSAYDQTTDVTCAAKTWQHDVGAGGLQWG